ncbi:phosphatidylserine/phosphatidylglycerophosphate/cardiolipin synthase family protein [Microbispora rosea]|uniref:phospholipase D-like domain-containing protein n=1 Tax=Microbispora rosea TaxID=58117 RepID=UPI00367928C9
MSTLNELVIRYFGPTGYYAQNTEIEYLIDGKRYLGALDAEIRATVKGDRIYLVDWFFDPTLDLGGRTLGDADFLEIGDLLAIKQQDGVDVRVVINGGQFLGSTNFASYRSNWTALTNLRGRVPPGGTTPPLMTRVLYDWTGADWSGTHHQKAALVMRNGVLTAFVAGIDINPLMLDDRPHNSRQIPPIGTPFVKWGWHDGGVRLVGSATADVYQNFAHRWEEAGTLEPADLWVRAGSGPAKHIRYDPGVTSGVPALPTQTTATPTAGAAVQVLRSRYDTKLNRPGALKRPWLTAGGGPLREVYDTMRKAIGAAESYIYIEDQFLGDHPALPDAYDELVWRAADRIIDGRTPRFSLLPFLKAAAKRGVKIIFVGSGYADPGDLFTGEKNITLPRQLKELAAGNEDRIAVWRLLQQTVHTKLMIVDDEFASIGSANLQARSMIGVDSELHVAVVSTGTTVRDLRARLWAEHLNVDYDAATDLRPSFDDVTFALGMWRKIWGNGVDWFTPDHPLGFTPATLGAGPRTDIVRAYVGPGGSP